jgi:hypothetical protein
MELFSQASNPYKEITESMSAYKNMKEFIDIKDPKETYIMIGDGSLALTAALFVFLTEGDAISIDPKLNLKRVCLWREREKTRKIYFCQTRFQDFAENNEHYIPINIEKDPYNLICVHAHVNLEELHRSLPNWKYLFTNPCCDLHAQTFSVQYQKSHNIATVKAGFDTENLSPRNMVFIYENKISQKNTGVQKND